MDGCLYALDQQRLPQEEIWIQCQHPQEMIGLIQRLAVRGAPLIGVAAAASLAQWAETGASPEEVQKQAHALREARPTAVNLMHAIDRLLPFTSDARRLTQEAQSIFDEDVSLCERLADHGAELISDGDGVLTHCNSGGLATAGIGTALGVIRRAHEQGKKIHVYVNETRPLLQGARLTAWELTQLKVPFTLITDSMAGTLMRSKRIQKVFTGADRIAKNGDAANKIGTYSLAVLARHHQIPFYIVAPHTTVDVHCDHGESIPIEQRNPGEVRGDTAPFDCAVYNPAFDITPIELITALVLDTGVKQTH